MSNLDPQLFSVPCFLSHKGVIFDVRSPAEYNHAHLPNAMNLPLFSNEERALIGTTYKKIGHNAAFNLGLKIVGPKLSRFVNEVKQTLSDRNENIAKVHCWRGGMRSGSIAWLLTSAGIENISLKGGYKAFRAWCLDTLKIPRTLNVIGGLTGSGKTDILQALKNLGEQVIDLEMLASHRGSAYGKIPGKSQPSNEHFENEIAVQWACFDPSRPVWIEDESRLIGCCKIPDNLYQALRSSPLYCLNRPLEERLGILQNGYQNVPLDELIKLTLKIKRRLGNARASEAIIAINSKNFFRAGEIILQYYDKCYRYSVSQRTNQVFYLQGDDLDHNTWAKRIIDMSDLCKTC